jgi:hypothetical protein
MPRLVWSSYIEGPRWVSVEDALRRAVIDWRAAGHDVLLLDVKVSRHLLWATTYFSVSAPSGAVMAAIQRAVREAT